MRLRVIQDLKKMVEEEYLTKGLWRISIFFTKKGIQKTRMTEKESPKTPSRKFFYCF